jgi:hypothetical protein
MTIEQTIEVPVDHRIYLELPRSIPAGVSARIEISVPAMETNGTDDSTHQPVDIEIVRQLLRQEMTEKGTLAVTAEAGSGWETHIKERYAKP